MNLTIGEECQREAYDACRTALMLRWAKSIAAASLALCLAFSTLSWAGGGTFHGKQTFMVREVQLEPFEDHGRDALNLDKPLYRLGEILKYEESFVVVTDYAFNGHEYIYSVVYVKVGKINK